MCSPLPVVYSSSTPGVCPVHGRCSTPDRELHVFLPLQDITMEMVREGAGSSDGYELQYKLGIAVLVYTDVLRMSIDRCLQENRFTFGRNRFRFLRNRFALTYQTGFSFDKTGFGPFQNRFHRAAKTGFDENRFHGNRFRFRPVGWPLPLKPVSNTGFRFGLRPPLRTAHGTRDDERI